MDLDNHGRKAFASIAAFAALTFGLVACGQPREVNSSQTSTTSTPDTVLPPEGETETEEAELPEGYPPSDWAGFVAFANTGDPNKLTLIRTETLGSAYCPSTYVFARVDKSVSGRDLLAAESAFFLRHNLQSDEHCSAHLYVVHDPQEATSSGFTAGGVSRSGFTSVPGAKHRLTVEAGKSGGFNGSEITHSFSIDY